MPIKAAVAVPKSKTAKTSIPKSAKVKTMPYGTIFIIVLCANEGNVSVVVCTEYMLIPKSITVVSKNAGTTSMAFALNLSVIVQPVVCAAAMVVSEMMERLSPSIDAPTTRPEMSAGLIESFCANPNAIGIKAAMLPIEEPMLSEKSEMIMNRPGKINDG